MATRILKFDATVGTTETTLGELSPPAGIKWTVVEIRTFDPGGTNYVVYRTYFDTELYHTIDSRVTPRQHPRPHVVGVDIAQPHTFRVTAQANAAGQTAIVEVVVEESPLAT